MTRRKALTGIACLILLTVLLFSLVGCYTTSTPTSETQKEKVYVGSINSNIYHYPSCIWAQKIKPENEIWFESVEDAKNQGYRPCKVCQPPG